MELLEFGSRLARLRATNGVSAREMSLSMGQSANYINKIETGKAYPSMTAFFDICDYLKIHPKDFFDDGNDHPALVNEMVIDYKRLSSNSQVSIADIVKSLTFDSER